MIATSATAAAVVCAVNRVARSRRDQADRLRAPRRRSASCIRQLFELDLAGRRKIAGIGPRRAEIIVAGTGTLLRILERFHAPAVYYSAAGVRDGIIADMAARGVGGELARLSRDQRKEVERVRHASSARDLNTPAALPDSRSCCSRALQPLHQLPLTFGRLLEAACYFSETGHYINDSGHHKHAYYIIANVDLSGFTNRRARIHRESVPLSSQGHAVADASRISDR